MSSRPDDEPGEREGPAAPEGGLRIVLVSPKDPDARSGNAVTVNRWESHLRTLGHEPVVVRDWSEEDGPPADVMVALHARRSASAALGWREARPEAPLVVALTGTDLYRDLEERPEARRAARAADRLVALQERAGRRLPPELRERLRVIHQSTVPPGDPPPPREDVFEAALVCHLRPVKDPLRAADAVRRLPGGSAVRVVHAGRALTGEMERRASREDAENPRYRWLGEVPRSEAIRLIARSRVLLVTSRLEGGANVVTEALACGTPVLGSRIDGNVGLLGEDYPGYFPVGDTGELAGLLRRVETDPAFRARLADRCAERAGLADPVRERRAWASLLEELTGDAPAADGPAREGPDGGVRG